MNTIKEITKDLANAIIRGDTMVPACSVGPLLAKIEELEMTQYIPPSKEEQLIKDFLIWCGREKGAVLVDITPNVAKMSNVTFINQMKAVEEYVASLQEGEAE